MHARSLTLIVPVLLLSLLVGCAPAAPAPAVEPTQPIEQPPAAEPDPTTAPQPEAPEANLTAGCVDTYAEGVDYFPEKTALEYASGFTVEYFGNYKVVTVTRPWSGSAQTFQYVLVQCGTPAPDDFEDALTVEVPASSFVSMSTTYLPMLEDLGRLDALVAVDNGIYVYNPAVRERLAAGEIAEVGRDADVNVEAVLDLDPSLIMASSLGFDTDAHPVLLAAGLPVVVNGDYVEPTALGRAEWVKFIALFYNEEARAAEVFGEIAGQYNEAAALAAGVEQRPTVFANTPFDDVWYMPGGDSYTAHMFADAGADYLWADDTSAPTLFLDFETVFDTAKDAEIWLNPFAYDLEGLATTDERFREFAAFQSGQVYAYNARETELGGNDFFESGAARPHIVLMDLIKIFHPDLLPDHELFYYRQLQ